MTELSILLVEDDEALRRTVQTVLSTRGYRVRAAATCADGLTLALEEAPHLLVLDIGLPDGTGWDLLARIRKSLPEHRLLTLVVSSNHISRPELRRQRVDGFVAKPFDVSYLAETVTGLLEADTDI